MPSRRFILPLLAAYLCRAAEPAPLPPSTPWNMTVLSQVPRPQWVGGDGAVRTMLFAGEPYKGRKTKVFAYYASPVTLGLEPSGKRKYPTVLLLPGGTPQDPGKWVQAWARHGYVALAINLEGNWLRTPTAALERLPDGGPPADDTTKFRLPDIPVADNWMYHAVADAILARSLLSIVPDVDQAHVGVTGNGWGGCVTCIVVALDSRFQAAVPVFACGFLEANSFWTARHFHNMTPEARQKWTQLWDPASYLPSVRTPMFFITGESDLYYPLDSYMKSYALVPGEKRISVQPKLAHGALTDNRDLVAFLDAQLKGSPPPPKIASVSTDNGRLRVEVDSKNVLKSASLHYTTGPHAENATRPWVVEPLSIDGLHVRGDTPPADATAWFVLVEDADDLLTSSEVVIK